MNRIRTSQSADLELFRARCAEQSINLDDRTIEKLTIYRDLLVSWNDRVRLLSRSDRDRIMTRHIFESLVVLRHLGADQSRIADLGSGGGLPGIPIKLAKPLLSVSLIESARMKTLFLKEVVRSMALSSIEVIHDRAESVALTRSGTFDVVTARAVARLDRVWELAEPLLKPQGSLIALKGPGEAEEDLAGSKVEFTEHIVEADDRTFAVVVVRKL